jgi:hypothetical protein
MAIKVAHMPVEKDGKHERLSLFASFPRSWNLPSAKLLASSSRYLVRNKHRDAVEWLGSFLSQPAPRSELLRVQKT